MKIKVFAPIHNLLLQENRGIKYGQFTITNADQFKEDLVNDSIVVSQIGSLHRDQIILNPIIYFEGDSSEIEALEGSEDVRFIGSVLCKYFSGIFSDFWLLKDNSVYTKECWVENLDIKNFELGFDNVNVTMHGIGAQFSMHDGKYLRTLFVPKETELLLMHIENLEKHYDSSRPIVPLPIPEISTAYPEKLDYVKYDFNRVIRAFLFLEQARYNNSK